MHSTGTAKMSQTICDDSNDEVGEGTYIKVDIWTIMKLMHEKLPEDLKIPPKVWTLLTHQAKDDFVNANGQLLGQSDEGPQQEGQPGDPTSTKPIPKQYTMAEKEIHGRVE
jgi:hypothetical protein